MHKAIALRMLGATTPTTTSAQAAAAERMSLTLMIWGMPVEKLWVL